MYSLPVSSQYVATSFVGGISCAAVPNGSESCQVLRQSAPLEFVAELTFSSDQVTEPSARLQPSPTQPAAPCQLCCSATLSLLYASVTGGFSPPGPAGRSIGSSK